MSSSKAKPVKKAASLPARGAGFLYVTLGPYLGSSNSAQAMRNAGDRNLVTLVQDTDLIASATEVSIEHTAPFGW